jgi:3-oxoacyl-[acyl-carrier protein] reductase
MLADAAIDDRIAPAALVTGGASGIGKAVCELLNRSGYLVAVADRDELGARAVADACGGFAFALDVVDEGSVSAVVSRAFDALGGKIDALVTSATVASDDADDAVAFERVHAVHVLGTHLCIREAARRMAQDARICTVAPVAGNSSGIAEQAAYVSAKAAVLALTRHAARALAGQGIAVNGVAPGPVPVKNVAEVVVWLLSGRASLVNGEVISVDGTPY